MDLRLTGKVAVITGGSAGIGRAIAHGLAAEGTHLVLCARDEKRLREVASEIEGVRVTAVPADLTDPGAAAELASVVEAEFGGADILIKNAGSGIEEKIMTAPDER